VEQGPVSALGATAAGLGPAVQLLPPISVATTRQAHSQGPGASDVGVGRHCGNRPRHGRQTRTILHGNEGLVAKQPGANRQDSVLRTVEEALANAHRHGSESSAQLNLETGGAVLVVECINPVARPTLPQPGHGLGLPGLRERMRLLGGRLSLAREAGVFTLRAELPAGRKPKKEPLHD